MPPFATPGPKTRNAPRSHQQPRRAILTLRLRTQGRRPKPAGMHFLVRGCPGGESVLAADLKHWGLTRVDSRPGRALRGSIEVEGTLSSAYAALIHCRLLQSIDVILARGSGAEAAGESIAADGGSVPKPDPLRAVLAAVPWRHVMAPDATFRVDALVLGHYPHTPRFLMFQTKDALVDAFADPATAPLRVPSALAQTSTDIARKRPGVVRRQRGPEGRARNTGEGYQGASRGKPAADAGPMRPSVDKDNPDLRLRTIYAGGELVVTAALGRAGLYHRTGQDRGGAPLRETLAATVLALAGWPKAFNDTPMLVDPCCGSGTLLLEGAAMALGRRPLLDALRQRGLGPDQLAAGVNAALSGWLGHDHDSFGRALAAAWAAQDAPLVTQDALRVFGYDIDPEQLDRAAARARQLGLPITFAEAPLENISAQPFGPRGLMVANPPYGERLGQVQALVPLYEALGDTLRRRFLGWQAAVLCADRSHKQALGLRTFHSDVVFNGPIECRLCHFRIAEVAPEGERARWRKRTAVGDMLFNRLAKNDKRLRKDMKRRGIEAYRLYASDIPEVRATIDRYGNWVHVRYFPRTQDGDPTQRRFDLMDAAASALGVPPEQVIVKHHSMHDFAQSHAPLGPHRGALTVAEEGLLFEVELQAYIDTGLFIDQRGLRRRLRQQALGKSVLNLFAYTCTGSVATAAGGASRVTSVDLSRTYLDWGRRNFARNRLDPHAHLFHQGDVGDFVTHCQERFDIIYCAPPLASTSKRAPGFHLADDIEPLAQALRRLLTPSGTLYLSLPGTQDARALGIATLPGLRDQTASYADNDVAAPRTPFTLFTLTS